MNLLLYYSLAVYLSLHCADASPDPEPGPATPSVAPPRPCTIKSPSSGAFFDLNELHIEDPTQSKSKHPRKQSWNTTGYDYGYNFTMNFCGPVIEELDDVVGVDKALWKNVSAFYTFKDRTFSLGQLNTRPVLRGRKLVLNYTGGSPCGESLTRRESRGVQVKGLPSRAVPVRPSAKHDQEEDDRNEDDDDDKPSKGKDREKAPSKTPTHRKSTIISFLCDRDPLAPRLSLNFVGADPEECTYFFEARSQHACAIIDRTTQSLSPGGVFGIIVLIAVIVYVVGGVVYSRVVLQQRGWRQCPNYGLWAGMFSFVGVRRALQYRWQRIKS